MFAKPNWFRTKSFNHGVSPANWRGWLYLVGIGLVAALPTLLLLGRHQGLEAFIWLAVVGVFLAYEVSQVRRHLLGHCMVTATAVPEGPGRTGATSPADEGIYFLDQRDGSQQVNTARFQLSLKQ